MNNKITYTDAEKINYQISSIRQEIVSNKIIISDQ